VRHAVTSELQPPLLPGVLFWFGDMWAALRRGVLAVEDPDFDAFCCHAPNEGFDFLPRTSSQVLQRRGGDHTIGPKPYSYFLAAGIPRPEIAVVQSLWTEGEEKTLACSTLEASADAIVSESIASEDEGAQALSTLQRFTANPQTPICGPRVFQLWSRQ
jgi:hypothetical protein